MVPGPDEELRLRGPRPPPLRDVLEGGDHLVGVVVPPPRDEKRGHPHRLGAVGALPHEPPDGLVGPRRPPHEGADAEAEPVQRLHVRLQGHAPLVVALVVLAHRRDQGHAAHEVRRLLGRRVELLLAQGAAAPGAHLAVAPLLPRDPLDAVEAVEAAPPRAAPRLRLGRPGPEKAPPVDDDVGVVLPVEHGEGVRRAAAARRAALADDPRERPPEETLVVGSLDENRRVPTGAGGKVEVGGEDRPVPHGDLHLPGRLAGLREGRRGREEGEKSDLGHGRHTTRSCVRSPR